MTEEPCSLDSEQCSEARGGGPAGVPQTATLGKVLPGCRSEDEQAALGTLEGHSSQAEGKDALELMLTGAGAPSPRRAVGMGTAGAGPACL